MLYRKFGQTGEELSILGFGCMRFPVINNNPKEIDEEEAIKQLRYGIDNGINYIDTAYPYHGGNSEIVVGKALKDGYREKVKLATKLPPWFVKTREDMDKYLNEQLNKLQTDHIDFYLLHSMNKTHWGNFKKNNVFDFIEEALADGRIKHIGFSFHDELSLFKEIVDSYDWDFCQIQYNFMDENYQAGKEGLKYAFEKGLGIIVMEPLRGGNLARNIPNDVKAVWDQADVKRSPAEWGFKFIWNQPEIGVVLSGMNEMRQIVENISTASNTEPNSLSKKEVNLIDEVKKIYKDRTVVDCTNCKYCMPCPFGVDIPGNFIHLNNASIYGDVERTKNIYNDFVKGEKRASNCRECGKCEEVCPQHINIRDMLKEVVKTFGE